MSFRQRAPAPQIATKRVIPFATALEVGRQHAMSAGAPSNEAAIAGRFADKEVLEKAPLVIKAIQSLTFSDNIHGYSVFTTDNDSPWPYEHRKVVEVSVDDFLLKVWLVHNVGHSPYVAMIPSDPSKDWIYFKGGATPFLESTIRFIG